NKLFAILDPLTRQLLLPTGMQVTLTDTVGFIQDLPTQFIEAFQSTLEETKDVDLLLHVIDASSVNMEGHEETVLQLLKDLEMDELPRLTVYNKKDSVEGNFFPSLFPTVLISAKEEKDIDALLVEIQKIMRAQMIPYTVDVTVYEGGKLKRLREETLLDSQIYDEEKEQYIVKGYAKKTSRWIGESSKNDAR